MTTFSAIGIVAEDLKASVEFYRGLGLDIPEQEGPHWEWTGPGGVRIMWDAADFFREHNKGWTPASGGPALALAFECQDPAEVDALHDAAATSVAKPFTAPWGQRYASIADPDGNQVDLFATL